MEVVVLVCSRCFVSRHKNNRKDTRARYLMRKRQHHVRSAHFSKVLDNGAILHWMVKYAASESRWSLHIYNCVIKEQREWIDSGWVDSAMAEEVTRVMVAVNESSMKGYPHPSISSKGAFEWTINKIVRNNVSAFNLLFLHVQVPDEDGSLSISLSFLFNCSLLLCQEILWLLAFGFCFVFGAAWFLWKWRKENGKRTGN